MMTGRVNIKVCLWVFAAMLFGGCGKDPTGIAHGTDEAEVEVTFRHPAQTRLPVAGENTVNTVDLLVFKRSGSTGNDAEYMYSRYAWLKSGSTYRAVLKEDSGLDIYFAINARSLIDNMNSAMAAGTVYTYADVKEMLVMRNPDQIRLTDGLPMWGMALDCTITGTESNLLGIIRLLRSVASTDITITAANFTLARGHIIYGADRGYLPYSQNNVSATNTDGDFHALQPEVPAGMRTDKAWHVTPPTGSNTINNLFYMYDNDADGTGGNKQTKVILEGRWSGSTQTGHTFYPLTFRDPDTNNKLNTKRNTKYIFRITNVNGDGYNSADEAKDAVDVNMDYEVIEWNQYNDGDIFIDGSHYFSIPSKRAILAAQAGAVAELVFSTNYALSEMTMKYNESDTGVANSIDTHHRFKVDVLTKSGGGNPYTCFAVTAKQAYGTSGNPATLIVTAGRIKFAIEMEQVQEKWEDGGTTEVELTYP